MSCFEALEICVSKYQISTEKHQKSVLRSTFGKVLLLEHCSKNVPLHKGICGTNSKITAPFGTHYQKSIPKGAYFFDMKY
jgi:hypothetical protein